MPIYKGPIKFTDPVTCPYCDSDEVRMISHRTTLIGWFGMVANEDPNHHTCTYDCDKCAGKFMYHYVIRDQAGWYTGDWRNDDASYCLKGKPGHCCKENYLYHCEKCETGWVEHSCHHQGMCFDQTGPKQAMYYQCMNCGNKTEDPRWPGYM